MFEPRLSRLDVVHEAVTREEREAVYRFRYTVDVQELAFFRDDGRRTASGRAVGDCQLLVLRRHLLRELGRSDPDLALQLHVNLGRLPAERLVRAELRSGLG